MNRMSLRPFLAPLAGLALCVVMTERPAANVAGSLVARFAGRAVSATDGKDAGPIQILVQRWSTDQDVQKLGKTFLEGRRDQLLPVLQQARQNVGVVLMPGVQGVGARARMQQPRNVLFAREIETAAGRQVILIAGQHLGLGDFARGGVSDREEFTLIDIRFDRDGKGIAKVAAADKVVYNKQTKMIEVGNYAAEPARLIDVRSDKPAPPPER